MHRDKSPGCDGFNPGFFPSHWSIVGQEVTATCLHWLQLGDFPPSINITNLVLIPKKQRPMNMTELRPIALCTVIYKIITKVLANRLKPVIADIVGEEQSGFVEGRLITDNIVIANEIVHWLKEKRQGRCGSAALKIDIAKAYDRLEWGYLERVLVALGFCSTWVSLVMKCVSSVQYQVLVGDSVLGPIQPSCGLRQGDPFSPYLFILGAEGLAALIKRKERMGLYHGCRIARSAPTITHLFFVDDAFLFFRATTQESQMVKSILDDYRQASGQKVNFSKSAILFSANVPAPLKLEVKSLLQVAEQEGTCKYLGLPILVGRQRRMAFANIKEKMRGRITAWKGRYLSRAGKAILLKTVAQAMPSYAMNLYILPDSTCNDLHRLMNAYWWGSEEGRKGLKWLRWERMCAPKDVGGMSFRDLKTYNKALVDKQGWRLLKFPDCLMARLLKARYFRGCSFKDAQLGASPSLIWKSIWWSSDVVRLKCRKRIGSGEDTNIWKDPWLTQGSSGFVSTVPASQISPQRVSELMLNDGRGWDRNKVRATFNEQDQLAILAIPLSLRLSSDTWVWQGNTSGQYTVKDGYKTIQMQESNHEETVSEVWKKLWHIQGPPKVLNLLWRATKECLPIIDNLLKRRVVATSICPVCRVASESTLHALVTCDLASTVWGTSGLGWVSENISDFHSWLRRMLDRLNTSQQSLMAAICWSLWKNMNSIVWNQSPSTVRFILNRSLSIVSSWDWAKSLRAPQPQAMPDVPSRWQKPALNEVSISVDAAVFETSGATGLVCRDHRGRFLGATVLKHPYMRDPALLEVLAIREALAWIKDRNGSNYVVESECLNVVTAINSSSFVDCYFGQLVLDCKDLLTTLVHVRVVFIRRTANQVAHNLVQAFGSLPGLHIWGFQAPACILANLAEDLSE